MRFLVAEASAISRAIKTTSFCTFFSRASASTSNSSSRLIQYSSEFLYPLISKLGHQTGLVEFLKSHHQLALFGIQTHAPVTNPQQGSGEIPLILDRHTQADIGLLSGEALEIAQLLERPVQARRRDFKTVEINILDSKNP